MYKYDFGLSFAGEDREAARRLAALLKAERIRVFYDHDEEAGLWGQDLYQKFQQIYGRDCRYFIPFVSAMVGKRVVVLHAFIKKTQQTPDRELKLARKRLKETQNG